MNQYGFKAFRLADLDQNEGSESVAYIPTEEEELHDFIE